MGQSHNEKCLIKKLLCAHMNVVIIPPGPDILQSHVILLRDTAVIFLYHSNYSNNVYVIQAEYVQLFVWDDIVRS